MPRLFSTFQAFVSCELVKVRTEFPDLSPNMAFQLAVRRWFFRGRFCPPKLLNSFCRFISFVFTPAPSFFWTRCDFPPCDQSPSIHYHKEYPAFPVTPKCDKQYLDMDFLFRSSFTHYDSIKDSNKE